MYSASFVFLSRITSEPHRTQSITVPAMLMAESRLSKMNSCVTVSWPDIGEFQRGPYAILTPLTQSAKIPSVATTRIVRGCFLRMMPIKVRVRAAITVRKAMPLRIQNMG